MLGPIKLVKADMCTPLGHLEKLRNPNIHGGGLLWIGIYPIQLACMVYDEMPETIQALGNLMDTGA